MSTDVLARAVGNETVERFLATMGTRPAALVIEGEAGIGKTTMWFEISEEAHRRGVRVVSSRPAQAESVLAYAAVADLLADVDVEIVDRDGTRIHVPVVPETEKVDPTGVGDGFRAGFLSALARGLDFERAAQVGSMVAVLVLETVSTQDWAWHPDSALARIEGVYGAEAAAEIKAAFAG